MSQKKRLSTPGPLTTSETVEQSMLRDLGSRDTEFLSMVSHIRRRLLHFAHVANGSHEAVLMQGSGSFAVEVVLSSVISPHGKPLLAINGAYGHRMAMIAKVLGIRHEPSFSTRLLP
jgi:2-aminoethylphosphonate-pyruvate transaminase